MAATISDTQAVARIIGMLGGMKIDSDPLRWANQVPVAFAVMNGVAEQLGTIGDVDNASIDPAHLSRAALKEIALEDLEFQILKGITGDYSQSNMSLAGYRLPSEIQREIDFIRTETQILEQGAELLNVRTQQILKGARSTSRDIRSLQDTYSMIQSTNDETIRRIDELSLHMDGTIADATQAGYSLLSSVEPLSCYDYTSCFEDVRQAHLDCTNSIMSHLDVAESTWSSVLTSSGIDADELDELFRRYSPDIKFEDMPLSVQEYYRQQKYVAQVEHLCDQMEEVHGTFPLSSDVLADATNFAEVDGSSVRDGDFFPNARGEIEASVTRDQATYMHARDTYLQNVVSTMEDSIMPPLNQLLSKLSLGGEIVDETEALCGVLSKEVQSALRTGSILPQPCEVAQPLELYEVNKGVREWEQNLETTLLEYGPGHEGLFEVLHSLNSSEHPFLDAIYANSPLNTSPPFAYSPHLMTLMEEARAVITQLGGETDRLTKEVESSIESRRVQRKLGAFVDQWITS